jgi:hypothetical protein
MIAHISGVPVEELLPVACGAGATWLSLFLGRIGQLADRLIHAWEDR